MDILLSIIAIVMSIIALSKTSTAEFKISKLENKLKELPPNPIQSQKEANPEPEAQTQKDDAQVIVPPAALAEQTPQIEGNHQSALTAQEQNNIPAKPVNIAQIFSWIGGILLVLGALFTFSYLIQKGYITIPLILSAAGLIGVLLAAVGIIIKDEKLQTTASTLCAAGISISFITVYCSYALFRVIDMEPAFVLMTIIAFSSFFISVYKNKQYISFLALAAAFLTPLLLSTGENNYIFFFTYLWIVNASAIAIAIKKGWNGLLWTSLSIIFIMQIIYAVSSRHNKYLYIIFTCYGISTACTALLPKEKIKINIFTPLGIFTSAQIFTLSMLLQNSALPYIFTCAVLITLLAFAYQVIHKTSAIIVSALAAWVVFYFVYTMYFLSWPEVGFAALGIFALFYIYPFAFAKKFKDGGAQWVTSIAAAVAAFTPVYINLGKTYFNEALGFIPLFFALCYLFPTITILDKDQFKRTKYIFISATIIFTTLILPVQFTEKWLTILLSVYAAALCWLSGKIENRTIVILAKIIFAAVFVRLVMNPLIFDYCASNVKIFNWYMLVFGVSAASMLFAAKFCTEKYNIFKSLLNAGGAFLLFALMNIEIADYFANATALKFDFSGEFAEAATYTLAWAAYGAAACIISFFNKSKILTKTGIIIICAALVKLALIDLWKLDTFYRIVGVFGMAAVLIAVAFLFQKYNRKMPQ